MTTDNSLLFMNTDKTDYSHVTLAQTLSVVRCLLSICIISKNYEKDLCLCRAVA